MVEMGGIVENKVERKCLQRLDGVGDRRDCGKERQNRAHPENSKADRFEQKYSRGMRILKVREVKCRARPSKL